MCLGLSLQGPTIASMKTEPSCLLPVLYVLEARESSAQDSPLITMPPVSQSTPMQHKLGVGPVVILLLS